MPSLLKQKQQAFDWFSLTPDERMKKGLPFNMEDVAILLGVKDVNTIKKWKQEWVKYKESEVADLEKELETSVGEKRINILNKMEDLCLHHDSHLAGQVWLRETKEEEQKEQIELTADEIAEQFIRSKKYLKEHGYLE